MDLIHPAEISGKIMTLLDQAKEEFIIISPYNNITYWRKLLTRIQKAQERGVRITWYTRANVRDNSLELIRGLGIEPIEVENLHCKLYLNESKAVVTSMNLSQVSDNASLDIGYYITEPDKYTELKDFVKTYIEIRKDDLLQYIKPKIHSPTKTFFEILQIELKSLPKRNYDITMVSKDMIAIDNFVYEGMELRFERRGIYFRVDFRINQEYQIRDAIYNLMEARKSSLTKIYSNIQFGSQMKRLKFDIQLFNSHHPDDLGVNEFNILWPHIIKIIKLLKDELNQNSYKNLVYKIQ